MAGTQCLTINQKSIVKNVVAYNKQTASTTKDAHDADSELSGSSLAPVLGSVDSALSSADYGSVEEAEITLSSASPDILSMSAPALELFSSSAAVSSSV